MKSISSNNNLQTTAAKRHFRGWPLYLTTMGLLCSNVALATNVTVTRTDDPLVSANGSVLGGGESLRSAILKANAAGAPNGVVGAPSTILFDNAVFATARTINLSSSLPMIFSGMTITGPAAGVTLDGGAIASGRRGLFVSGLPTPAFNQPANVVPNQTPQPITVFLSNMTLQNFTAKGGDGGGGGMGAGGGLFINQNADVTLGNVNFISNRAIGGAGGAAGAGIISSVGYAGGGGMGGDGGTNGGGGGLGGNGGVSGGGGIGGDGGGNSTQDTGGGGGFGGQGIGQILLTQGFTKAGDSNFGPSSPGGDNGGGGGCFTPAGSGDGTGSGSDGDQNLGAVGGGGGSSGKDGSFLAGGSGGIGGGGGGSDTTVGGAGGFGGGGGYSNGAGGFGGGGASEQFGVGGSGGFGGGGGYGGTIGGDGGFGGGGAGGPDGGGLPGFGGGFAGQDIDGTGNVGGGGAAMGGAIFVADGGTLSITGTNTISGNTLFGGARGVDGGSFGQTFGSGMLLQGNGTLTLNGGGADVQTYNDSISDLTGVGGTGQNAGIWGLHILSAGTVVLAGNNQYSGVTVVDGGGILSVSSNANLGSSGGLTLDGSTLRITGTDFTSIPRTITRIGVGTFDIAAAANTFTISQVLAGGALTKTGPGTLALTGANTYTGMTTINAGSLSVGADNNLGNAANGLTIDGGTLRVTGTTFNATPRVITWGAAGGGFNIVDAANTFTVPDILAGGSLTKSGLGKLVLTGANSYTGGTFLNGGVLEIAAANNLGGAGALTVNGGTLRVMGALAGLGRAIIWGPLGGGFDIVAGGNNFVVNDNLTGGPLTKLGLGNLILLGVNTYTGPTLINAGGIAGNLSPTTDLTVLAGAAYQLLAPQTIGSLSGAGIVNLGAFTLTTGNSLSTIYTGNMNGTGGLIKQGTGAFTITNSTFTGDVFVNAGTLNNFSNLAGDVTVAAGATYAGNGSSGNLISSGIVDPLAPGGGTGTMVVNGDYTQNPTGELDIKITPVSSDLLQVTGTANLSGTLDITPTEFTVADYIVLTANNIVGTFTTVLNDILQYTVTYNPTSVVVRTALNIEALVQGGNPGIIARYFDQIAVSGNFNTDLDTQVLAALENVFETSGVAGLTDALEIISPDPYRELGFVSFQQSNFITGMVGSNLQSKLESLSQQKVAGSSVPKAAFTKLQQLKNDPYQGINLQAFNTSSQKKSNRNMTSLSLTEGNTPLNKTVQMGKMSVWLQGAGALQNKKNASPIPGTRSTSYGTAVGADVEVMPQAYLGVTAGAVGTHFDWMQNRGNGNVTSYYGGVYGLWLSQMGFYVDGQVNFGSNSFNSHRKINFGGLNRTATQSHKGTSYSGDFELGYMMNFEKTTVQPFVNYAYFCSHENGFTEKNAISLNVRTKSRHSKFSRSEVGGIISHFMTSGDKLIYPSLKLSWVQKRPIGGSKVSFNLVGQPFGTTVYGDKKVRNLVAAGGSLTAQYKSGVSLTGNINVEGGGNEVNASAMLTARYQF